MTKEEMEKGIRVPLIHCMDMSLDWFEEIIDEKEPTLEEVKPEDLKIGERFFDKDFQCLEVKNIVGRSLMATKITLSDTCISFDATCKFYRFRIGK